MNKMNNMNIIQYIDTKYVKPSNYNKISKTRLNSFFLNILKYIQNTCQSW